MGCDVVVAGARSRTVAEVRALFDLYDETFSRFKAGSELVRLNAAGSGAMSPLHREALKSPSGILRRRRSSIPRVGVGMVGVGRPRLRGRSDRREPPGRACALGELWRAGPLLRLGAGGSWI